jgi:hypothetical protein
MHIALWLLKDCFWVMTWRAAGMLMIIPTLLVAADITWRNRKDIHELFPNLAVCFWICANATWMTGEFYFYDGLRDYAKIFFGLGFLTVFIYYAFFFKHHASEAHNAGQ